MLEEMHVYGYLKMHVARTHLCNGVVIHSSKDSPCFTVWIDECYKYINKSIIKYGST